MSKRSDRPTFVAAGANVEILGNVKEGLKAFGGNIVLSGDVEGALAFAGTNVILSRRYHDQAKAAAANLILSGTFDRNGEAGGAKITPVPTARIKGDLIYSAAIFDRQEGSQIMGKVAEGKTVVNRQGGSSGYFSSSLVSGPYGCLSGDH